MSDAHDDDQGAAMAAEIVELRAQIRLLSTKLERVDATTSRNAQGLDELEDSVAETARQLAAAVGGNPDPNEAATVGAPTAAGPGAPSPAGGGAAPAVAAPQDPLDMAVLVDWVHRNVGEWAQRKLPLTAAGQGGFIWCAQWYEHPEAITILWLLRRSWLEAVTQPGAAMFVYYRDFYYPALRVLSEDNGPFHACNKEKHHDSEFVPTYPSAP